MATPSNVEGGVVDGGDTAAKRPLLFVLERADDGTWVAVPEYAGEDDDERAHCCGSRLPGKVTAGSKSKARSIMLVKWALAATITDFKNDIREFIQDYFNPSVDRHVQLLKLLDLLHEPAPGDLRTREMLLLLFAAVDEDRVPADTFEAAVLREDVEPSGHQPPVDDDEEKEPSGHQPPVDDEEKEPRYPAKPVSEAGFVNRDFMRMCIKAFFDPDIHVHDEAKDTHEDRHLWGNFMSATGFVNRLRDVKRIVKVFFNHDLDPETRKATMAGMMRDLDDLLKARATAVSTGRFNLFSSA
jgi:hypothetical protein